MNSNKVVDALLGVAIGDAVGVPFEFSSRDIMRLTPATDMKGYGTYNLPEGTWSDDSSLTFCLAESLAKGYDLKDISEKFIQWKSAAYWSARGRVFDIGLTTSKAIARLQQILNDNALEKLKHLKDFGDEYDNGNGSLMRIIPLLFYIDGKPIRNQFDIIWEISALTHRHIRAAMSCLIYLKLAEKLLHGKSKTQAYRDMRNEIMRFWDQIDFPHRERQQFHKVIQNDITETSIGNLKSGGYVIEVLESSIWFFLNTDSYEKAILSIINIGHDTDTSAAITGGLAGIYYGQRGMPQHWVNTIARRDDIIELGNKLSRKYFV